MGKNVRPFVIFLNKMLRSKKTQKTQPLAFMLLKLNCTAVVNAVLITAQGSSRNYSFKLVSSGSKL